MPNGIPGFDEATAKEREARNSVYLGLPQKLCGFSVRDITPRILCFLTQAKSPFVYGGAFDPADATPFVQFISFVAITDAPEKTFEEIGAAALLADLDAWCAEIDEFVALTFLDAPTGGKSDDAPIASAIAWLEYRMAGEPFRWDSERTLDTALRRLYQLIRCWQKEQGDVVVNALSGKCESDWLDTVNGGLKDGGITPAMIEEMQARACYRKAGIPFPGIEHLIIRPQVIHEVLPPETAGPIVGPAMPADTEAKGREMQ